MSKYKITDWNQVQVADLIYFDNDYDGWCLVLDIEPFGIHGGFNVKGWSFSLERARDLCWSPKSSLRIRTNMCIVRDGEILRHQESPKRDWRKSLDP